MAGTRWTGKGYSHSWFNATKWSQGVPEAQQTVALTDGPGWIVDLAGSAHAASDSMSVLSDALLFKSGTLDLAAAPPNSGNPIDLSIGRGGSVTVTAGATSTAGNFIVAGVVQGSIPQVFDGSANIAEAHAHVPLAGNYTAASFAWADDHHGGTAMTFAPGPR